MVLNQLKEKHPPTFERLDNIGGTWEILGTQLLLLMEEIQLTS